jgi:hypothetical protein
MRYFNLHLQTFVCNDNALRSHAIHFIIQISAYLNTKR